MGRLLGRWGFLVTVAGDALKGLLAVGVPRLVGLPPLVLALSTLAATLGHIFPAQLRFHGGKGVTVAVASLTVLDPRYALVLGVVAGGVYLLVRKEVLAGLLGMLAVPLAAWALGKGGGEVVVLSLLVAAIFVAHRRNIRSLFQGGSGAGV